MEFGEITGLWLGREGGGWEALEGVTHVDLEVESPPAEDVSGFETEFEVRKLFSWVPTCPSGVHPQHPGDSCEEHEQLAQAYQDFIDRLFATVYAQAQQAARRYEEAMARFLDGFEAWEPRGLLASLAEPVQSTPIERALQILEPHLAREPLYQPGPQTGRRVAAPSNCTAHVPVQQHQALTSTNRPAWQSPYGPPSRRR